jgi:hypothetical protein
MGPKDISSLGASGPSGASEQRAFPEYSTGAWAQVHQEGQERALQSKGTGLSPLQLFMTIYISTRLSSKTCYICDEKI